MNSSPLDVGADRCMDAEVRIEELLGTAAERIAAGEFVDVEAIERRHLDLMPELGRRLRDLRVIALGRRAAAICQDDDGDADLLCLADELPDYKIVNRIHRGGQGAVYRAEEIATGRQVAIKVLSDGPFATSQQRRRFTEEIKVTARFRHPHVVTIYRSGVVRHQPYYVMEYVEGAAITDYAIVEGLSARQRVELFILVVRAVGHAHQRAVLHRDLKPSNILVDALGLPHILDFGLAKALDVAEHEDEQLSMAGNVVGTLPYLSPEQARGCEHLDVRSDLYSLAVVLFELLTGDFPYPIRGARHVVRDVIINRKPQRLRECLQGSGQDGYPAALDIDDDLEAIVARALAKDPDDRYQSADALASDLERYVRGEAVQAKADHGLYVLRKTLRKYRLYVSIAGIFAAFCILASIVIASSWASASRERDNAREALRVAQSTLTQVVGEVDESIKSLAGGIVVRDRLLQGVKGNLEILKSLVKQDESLGDVATALAEKQGDIARAEGRNAEAAGFFHQALPAHHPSTLDAIASVRLHGKLADVLDDAAGEFEKAIAIGAAASAAAPSDRDLRFALCQVHGDYALFLVRAGRYADARTELATASQLMQAWRSYPNSELDRWQSLAASLLEWQSDIEQKQGDALVARRLLAESLDLKKEIAQRAPWDVSRRPRVLMAHIRLAESYADAGELNAAVSTFRQVVEWAEQLQRAEPSVSIWKHCLHSAHDGMGRALLLRDDACAARDSIDRAYAISEDLLRADALNVQWRQMHSFSLLQRGRIALDFEDYVAAITDLQAAADLRIGLCQDEPGDPEFVTEYAHALDYLGQAFRMAGRRDEAWACYEQALSARSAIDARQPDVTSQQLDILLSYSKLATWLLQVRSVEADNDAKMILAIAENSLESLCAAGRLANREGNYQEYAAVLHKNFKLIAGRAHRRAIDEDPVFNPSAAEGAMR